VIVLTHAREDVGFCRSFAHNLVIRQLDDFTRHTADKNFSWGVRFVKVLAVDGQVSSSNDASSGRGDTVDDCKR
jgi:hypothetical protein